MNKRKLIYFLSAFVLIIGCYALNLSYSLFTQNITSENNVVDTSIPLLSARLETNTYTIPANNGEVVTLKILNSGTANIQYGISINELPEGINAYLVEKEDNDIVGKVEASQSKEVLVYLENTTENESTITFNLDAKYETVSFDKTTFISNSNIDCVNKVKSLSESILARAKDTTITDETKTTYDESFDSSNINDVSGENERKLIKAEDDYGTSYVFRGAVKDNYVNFAGFTWRIVRINGDGSIRLILDGTLDKVCADYEKDSSGNCTKNAGPTSAFNLEYDDNAYVGYMYGFTGGVTNKCLTKDANKEYTVDSSTTYTTKEDCETAGGRWAGTAYETTHINKNSTTIKTNIDTFYETYIENGTTKKYEEYLADTMFCGDKTLSSQTSPYSPNLGYAKITSDYAAVYRLVVNETSVSLTNPAKPTLKCAEEEMNTYSRFTMEEQNRNNVRTNGDLKHPIALLSSDELVLAGAFINEPNKYYYLYDSYVNGTSNSNWWLLTPWSFDGFLVMIFNNSKHSFGGDLFYNVLVDDNHGIRPVINLKSNLLIESGDGTKEITYDEEGNILTEGPYILK